MSVREPYEGYSAGVQRDYEAQNEQAQASQPRVVELLKENWGVETINVHEDSEGEERSLEDLEADLNGVDLSIPRLDYKVAVKTKSPSMLDGFPYWDVPLRIDGRNGGSSEWERFEKASNGEEYDGDLPDYIVVYFGDDETERGWALIEVAPIVDGLRTGELDHKTQSNYSGEFELLMLESVSQLPLKASSIKFTEEDLAKEFARKRNGSEDAWECYYTGDN